MISLRSVLSPLADSRSVAHGVTTSAATAALTLVDPRRLGVGGRVAYRVGLAALTGWIVWASLRDEDVPPISRGARAAIVTASVGGTLALAEAGEAIDGRLQDGLARAGLARPRVWMAAASGALGLASWWTGRLSPAEPFVPIEELLDTRQEVPPAEVRAIAERLLGGTDGFGAPELRAQLAAARVEVSDMFDDFTGDVYFVIPDDLPRAVPGSGEFVVRGRSRGLEGITFDVTLSLSEGRLGMLSISPGGDWTDAQTEAWYEADRSPAELGGWPDPSELMLLIETPAGRREL